MEKFYKTDSIEAVKSLCKICRRQICDVDVRTAQSRRVVNGKSILGLFSVNLNEGFYVKLHTEDQEDSCEFFEQLDELFGV